MSSHKAVGKDLLMDIGTEELIPDKAKGSSAAMSAWINANRKPLGVAVHDHVIA